MRNLKDQSRKPVTDLIKKEQRVEGRKLIKKIEENLLILKYKNSLNYKVHWIPRMMKKSISEISDKELKKKLEVQGWDAGERHIYDSWKWNRLMSDISPTSLGPRRDKTLSFKALRNILSLVTIRIKNDSKIQLFSDFQKHFLRLLLNLYSNFMNFYKLFFRITWRHAWAKLR